MFYITEQNVSDINFGQHCLMSAITLTLYAIIYFVLP